jgi:hypothetical protein
MTMPRPGDIANGHILSADFQWVPLPPEKSHRRGSYAPVYRWRIWSRRSVR